IFKPAVRIHNLHSMNRFLHVVLACGRRSWRLRKSRRSRNIDDETEKTGQWRGKKQEPLFIHWITLLHACSVSRRWLRHLLRSCQFSRGLHDVALGKWRKEPPAGWGWSSRLFICRWSRAIFAVLFLYLRQHSIDERLIGLPCRLGL